MLIAVSLSLVEVTSLLRSHLESAGGSGRQLLVFLGFRPVHHPSEVIHTVHNRLGPCKMGLNTRLCPGRGHLAGPHCQGSSTFQGV